MFLEILLYYLTFEIILLSSEKETLNENEQFIENVKEYRGWDLPSESYRIGERSWKVNKDCKKPVQEEKIRVLSDKIEETRKKLNENKIEPSEALKISRQCNKEILELALIAFDYDKEVQEIGHKTLGEASVIMQGLFLEIGGFEEMIYIVKSKMVELEQRLKLAKATRDG